MYHRALYGTEVAEPAKSSTTQYHKLCRSIVGGYPAASAPAPAVLEALGWPDVKHMVIQKVLIYANRARQYDAPELVRKAWEMAEKEELPMFKKAMRGIQMLGLEDVWDDVEPVMDEPWEWNGLSVKWMKEVKKATRRHQRKVWSKELGIDLELVAPMPGGLPVLIQDRGEGRLLFRFRHWIKVVEHGPCLCCGAEGMDLAPRHMALDCDLSLVSEEEKGTAMAAQVVMRRMVEEAGDDGISGVMRGDQEVPDQRLIKTLSKVWGDEDARQLLQGTGDIGRVSGGHVAQAEGEEGGGATSPGSRPAAGQAVVRGAGAVCQGVLHVPEGGGAGGAAGEGGCGAGHDECVDWQGEGGGWAGDQVLFLQAAGGWRRIHGGGEGGRGEEGHCGEEDHQGGGGGNQE